MTPQVMAFLLEATTLGGRVTWYGVGVIPTAESAVDAETSANIAVAGIWVTILSSEEISNHLLEVTSSTEAENSSYCWYQGSDQIL